MAKRPGGLGRGLEALFSDTSVTEEVSVVQEENDTPEVEAAEAPAGVRYIDINLIKPNASQPRKVFDESKIKELADSISQHGMIQPIIVRPSSNGYEIVAGERRWRASRKAELKEVPCIIRELSDRENMLFAIIENMQREDLNPIEEALAFREMIEQYSLTQSEVSKSLGKSRPYITNALRLLKLPEEVQQMVSEQKLSGGHARAIAGVENEETQIKLASLCVEKGFSVRALENMISELGKKPAKPAKKSKSADIVSVENELKQILGTKVTIPSNLKKGKIEISYFSQDELERLIEALKTIKTL